MVGILSDKVICYRPKNNTNEHNSCLSIHPHGFDQGDFKSFSLSNVCKDKLIRINRPRL